MTISLAAMEWNFEFVKWNFLFSIHPLSWRAKKNVKNCRGNIMSGKRLLLYGAENVNIVTAVGGGEVNSLRSLITEAC